MKMKIERELFQLEVHEFPFFSSYSIQIITKESSFLSCLVRLHLEKTISIILNLSKNINTRKNEVT